MRIAAQLARMGGKTGARYAGLTTTERSGPIWTGEMRVAEDLLTWPLLRRQPRRIAVSLMSELFHENLATASIDLVHAVMRAAHWHQFLVLTKRAGRMRAYYNDPETPHRIAEKSDLLSSLMSPTPAAGARGLAGSIGPDPRAAARPGHCPISGLASRSKIKNAWPGSAISCKPPP